MTKVLLCVNSDIGRGNTIGFRFGKIAKELKRRNIDFDVIARANYDHDLEVKTPFFKNNLGRILNVLHSHLFPAISFRWLDAWIFDSFVLHTLKKNKKEYSYVHFGEYLPKSSSYIKKQGAKIFLDIPIAHARYAEYLKEKGMPVDKLKINPIAFLDKAIKLADVLVIPSEFVKETLDYAGAKTPTVVIPFGVDINKAKKNRPQSKQNDELTFLYAGAVNMRKGIKYLLQAWQKADLKKARLIICGRVYKEVKGIIKNYAKENVDFVGFVDVRDYLSRADVFVLPSLFEGSSKAIYEAMSFGLPVITTPNAGSVIEDDVSGFIVPAGEVDALAEKINFFAQTPAMVEKMGVEAKKQVANYTWDNYAAKVVDLYGK